MLSEFQRDKEVYLKCLMTWHNEILMLDECGMDKLKQSNLHEPPNLNLKLNNAKFLKNRG